MYSKLGRSKELNNNVQPENGLNQVQILWLQIKSYKSWYYNKNIDCSSVECNANTMLQISIYIYTHYGVYRISWHSPCLD